MSFNLIQAEIDIRAWINTLLGTTAAYSFAPDNKPTPYATVFLIDTENIAMHDGDSGIYSLQMQINTVGRTLLESKTEASKIVPPIVNQVTIQGSTVIAGTFLENMFDNYDPDTELFYTVIQVKFNIESNG